jgi:hypothetical protein
MFAKFRKIRSMSMDEFLFRTRTIIYQWVELCMHLLHLDIMTLDQFCNRLPGVDSNHGRNGGLSSHFKNVARDQFFTEGWDKSTRSEFISEYFNSSSWVAQANRLLLGQIRLLGRRMIIPFSGGWHADPVKDGNWPRKFYFFAAKKRRVSGWDIKFVWEINRQQYLIVLAKAYWLTGDERFAAKAVSAIDSWIDENPYNKGVNWTSSLELAIRTISWLWTYFLCQGSNSFTDKFQSRFFLSIYRQATYIEKHLSIYSSPYNHLIGEAASLHIIGSLFPMFDSGRRWEKLGWSIMANTVCHQFHEDGMSVEQASFYHHFTLGFYLQSIFLRRNNKKRVPAKMLERIEKALEFSMYLAKPDGTLPMVGDIDNARSLYFDLYHSWDFRGFLSLGAVLFKRPDFKRQSSGICEELLWLASENDLKLFMDLETSEPATISSAFRKSGYFISRDNWFDDSNYLCFDCGPMAAGLSSGSAPSAAHGHADALSFELVVAGKSFVVDGGFYTYFGELDWHRHFRREEAHNTLSIGDYRQADYCGRLKWQNVRNPELIRWQSEKRYDAVSGAMDFGGGVVHLRQMAYVKDHFWLLRDFVENADNDGTVESFMHFSPKVDLRAEPENCQMVASRGNVGLIVKYCPSVELRLEKGGEHPASGWVAHGYGIKFPAWRAVFSWQNCIRPGPFAMLMFPFFGDKSSHDIEIMEPDSFDFARSAATFRKNGQYFSVNMEKRDLVRISTEQSQFDIDFSRR